MCKQLKTNRRQKKFYLCFGVSFKNQSCPQSGQKKGGAKNRPPKAAEKSSIVTRCNMAVTQSRQKRNFNAKILLFFLCILLILG
jgi:hypothetical protein